ncbi:MAG: hypothetical protein IPJ84_09615 [Bdellovibrionales bacterium]|nr:hypothetical protein [Bdellovibrionales bacterium]
MPDLKEAERYFLKELEAAKKMLAESPEGDPNATLHWLAKKKSIAIRARLPKYIDCSLSPSDVLALSYYTGSGYASINSALRKPENKRSELERKIAAAVTPSLNAALDKLKPYIGIVRRGAALPEDVLAEHKIVGHTIEYKSYVSTSLGLGWQRPHLFVIHSRTGRYVAPYSSSYGEAEVLFKPGTKFKVLEVVEEGPVTKFVLDEVVE